VSLPDGEAGGDDAVEDEAEDRECEKYNVFAC
jgi:hypothetical protein